MASSHQKFTQEDFSWSFKIYPHWYNQVPGLPIYIGQGGTSEPVGRSSPLDFINCILKPIKANRVVAIGIPGIDFPDYFGEFNCHSLWEKNSEIKDVKWKTLEEKGKKYTFISKARLYEDISLVSSSMDGDFELMHSLIEMEEWHPNSVLHHLKVFEDDSLYYETYVLHRSQHDAHPIRFQGLEAAQILHDIQCETLKSKNTVLYYHCAHGIGRSGSALLAHLLFAQYASLPLGDLLKLPSVTKPSDFPAFLNYTHQKIRSGLLSCTAPGNKLAINLAQVEDCLTLGNYLHELHQTPAKSVPLQQRVFLTDCEVSMVFKLIRKETLNLDDFAKIDQEHQREIRIAQLNWLGKAPDVRWYPYQTELKSEEKIESETPHSSTGTIESKRQSSIFPSASLPKTSMFALSSEDLAELNRIRELWPEPPKISGPGS